MSESDGKIRPESFGEFVGQEQPKRVLEILASAAKKRAAAAGHTLIIGAPGLGKTTLARLLARIMNSRLIEVVGPNLTEPRQIQAQLASLRANDVLFLDECHAMPRVVEECLYGPMEDGVLNWVPQTDFNSMMRSLGIGSTAKEQVKTMKLPPFTLVGATTLPGLMSPPLRSRFVQSLVLEPYTVDELEHIVVNTARKLGFGVTKPVAGEIARRSRNTARIAVGHLVWFRDYCLATGAEPTVSAVREAFTLKNVDESGLGKVERQYLDVLVNAQVPVGLSTLSASLGENVATLTESVEPYLLREGYIRRTARGRVAERKAYDLVGRSV